MKYRIRQAYDHKVDILEDKDGIYEASQYSIGEALNYHAAHLQFEINHQENILNYLKEKQRAFMEWINNNEKEILINKIK